MRTRTLVALCVTVTMAAGCAGGGETDDGFLTFYEGGGDGDGDGDGSGSDEGDGDPTTTGDGDPTTTGDGDPTTTGDGDGDPTTGDGDPTTGDGDGDGDGDIPIGPGNMIDNLEDGDGAIIPNNGRQGYWYVFNDATPGGIQTPLANMVLPESGGAAGTSKAMHTSGSGFAEWGAGVGVDFNNSGGIKMTWDASQFTGIVLMAKGSGQVWTSVQIEATVPVEEGGTCASSCDAHGKLLVLSGTWQQFTLPFNQLSQEGWGTPAGWDPSKLVGIQFKVGKDTNFDFWIDEIGFY